MVSLPGGSECAIGFGSSAPAQSKLYCGQKYANEQTLEGYQSAIQLVNSIDESDPLRQQADQLIQQWTPDIMRLAELEFQKGEFDKAISAAERVPARVKTYAEVVAQIEHWRKLWSKAESIYADADQAIDKEEWSGATETARKLLTLGNDHWATTRFKQLAEKLESKRGELLAKDKDKQEGKSNSGKNRGSDPLAQMNQKLEREAAQQLGRAQSLAESGSPQALKQAIREAGQVMYGTPQRDKADALIADLKQQLRQKRSADKPSDRLADNPVEQPVDTLGYEPMSARQDEGAAPRTLPPAELPPINQLGENAPGSPAAGSTEGDGEILPAP
jgi:tetratricopeptide (TPR) repeat protein